MIRSTGLAYAYPGSSNRLAFPDLDLEQGGVLVLQGPSGSGKSTWLALAAALVRPSQGQLQVAGQDLGALRGAQADAWRARHVGFLPQRLHLSASLNVLDNLRMAQWAAGQPDDARRAMDVLQALDVAALAQRRPSQLSGGQAQRVALARCLLQEPQLLLADEPTASLDDGAAQAALDMLLTTSQAQGATLVVATHDRRVHETLAGPVGAARGVRLLQLQQQAAAPATQGGGRA